MPAGKGSRSCAEGQPNFFSSRRSAAVAWHLHATGAHWLILAPWTGAFSRAGQDEAIPRTINIVLDWVAFVQREVDGMPCTSTPSLRGANANACPLAQGSGRCGAAMDDTCST